MADIQAFSVINTSPDAEELLEATAQCIESNLYQIIVVNSFGALLTKAEEETDITQKHYGGAAMPITNFMKRVHSALNNEDINGQPNTTTINDRTIAMSIMPIVVGSLK